MVSSSDKKLMDALRESEQNYRAVFNSANDGIFIHDMATRQIVDVNETMLKMYGFTDKQEVIDGGMELISALEEGYTKEKAGKLVQNALLSDKKSFEWLSKKKNGEYFWIEVSITKTEIGGKDRFLATVRDISDRKKAEDALRESEKKYRQLIENSHDIIYTISMEGIFTFVSPAWTALVGHPLDQVIGKPSNLFVHPDDIAKSMIWMKELMETGQRQESIEYRVKHLNGSWRWHSSNAVLLKDKAGNIIGFEGSASDITDRKKAEDALRESEETFRQLFEQSADAVMLLDKTVFVDCNNAHLKLFGYSSKEEVINNDPWKNAPEFQPDGMLSIDKAKLMMAEAYKKGHYRFEWLHKKSDGTPIPIEAMVTLINLHGKQLLHMVLRDTTEHKKAEEALRESEEKYRSFIEETHDGISLINEDAKVILWNRALEKISGLPASRVIGRKYWDVMYDLLPPERKNEEHRIKLHTVILNALQTGIFSISNSHDVKVVRPDGSFAYISDTVFFIKTSRGFRFGSVVHDITEKKLAAEAVAAEKERLSVTLRSIGDGVITSDTKGTVVIINKAAEELTGWTQEEAFGKPLNMVFNIINEITGQQCENPVEKVLASGHIEELANHTVLISRDGTKRIIADSGAPIKDQNNAIIGVVLVFRDMTEKQKLIENIHQAQKLESLGVLAGGIAHDFNNLLGGIFGYIDLAIASAKNPETSKYLSRALNAVDRAKNLTRQLLTFAKGGAPAQKPELLIPFIQETTLFALSGSSVSSNFDIPDNIWPCNFDRNQIAQVIDNLVINAQQAMAMGGMIFVSAHNISSGAEDQPVLGKGKYVAISIKDTGIGIPKEILPRIFDPFFTTKQKGHGLGLASCYSIVTQHGGIITATSEPGKGSIFTIYLPALEASALPASSSLSSEHKGSGRIIIMDDEELIREIMSEMFSSLGYSVLSTRDGAEAIAVFKKEMAANRPVTAMIFDLTVPGGMGGEEAVAELRKMNINIPIFMASGYSDAPVMSNPGKYGFTASIFKPFTLRDLVSLLNRYLTETK